MISINTNISSLVAQNSLKKSSLKLNQAIERMTTGFKINHAKDNAADYSITTNLDTQISAYQVTEENTELGLDLLTTANDNLDIINDRLARLRALSEQAANGTYGESSLLAINAECNALVDEINRLYLTTEYNGNRLFIDNSSGSILQTQNADSNTTFKELGIGRSSFSVLNEQGNIVESYDTEETDTIGDLFNVLKTQGFSCGISNGKISIKSSNGYYISGDLVNSLGITTTSSTYTVSSAQTSTGAVTYNETTTATGSTTLAELGISGTSTVVIKDKEGTQTGSFNISSTSNLNNLFSSLAAHGIDGNINNGVITLTSSAGNIAEGSLLNSLGIGKKENGNFTITTSTESTKTEIVTPTAGFANEINRINTDNLVAFSEFNDEVGTYAIKSTEDLYNFIVSTIFHGDRYNANQSTIILGCDLDLTEFYEKYDIESFAPIGALESSAFMGIFDGNGYTISNLKLSATELNSGRDTTNAMGLFGYCDGATIKNLAVEIAETEGTINYVGGLIGNCINNPVTIENCYTTGNISNESGAAGGLVGYAKEVVTIINSSSSININSGNATGGLVGFTENTSIIDNCYAIGSINGGLYTGGLVGAAIYNTTINNSYYAVGELNADYSISALETIAIGGLVGLGNKLNINHSYVDANITNLNPNNNESATGGLVAISYGNSTINNCYVKGNIITGNGTLDYTGGFAAGVLGAELTIQNSEMLAESNVLKSIGAAYLDNGSGGTVTMTNCHYNSALTNLSGTQQNCTETTATSGSFDFYEKEVVKYTITTTATQTLYANTDSKNLNSSVLKTLTNTTTFGQLGFNSPFNITVNSNGTISTFSVNQNTTFTEFANALQTKGLSASVNNGIVSVSGNGICSITNNIFNLGRTSYTTGSRPANTDSKRLQYTIDIQDSISGNINAPGSFTLQVGIYGDENSRITIQTAFLLPSIDTLRGIGLDNDNYMSLIDEMIQTISMKQTEYGAAQNRLESALEEISTHYENLSSSRSTLKDADIAEVSSEYIRQQILQQASATLLATANQSPALALQLI